MSNDHPWSSAEERLLLEASSLGDILEWLRSRVSPALVGAGEWKSLLDRAQHLPATLAAFPFGFELPLGDPRTRADLGVTVTGGSRSAAFFEQAARSEDADASTRGVARLLAVTAPEDSLLRRVVGRKMMLEYDIDVVHGAHPLPGLFLYSVGRTLAGDGSPGRLGALDAVVGAIASAKGVGLDGAVRRHIEGL